MVSAWVDSGPDGEWCLDRLADDDLAAPALVPFEAADVLRRMHAAGEVDATTASLALADLRSLPVDLVAFEPLADRVWELRNNLTAYDASHVAAAEAVGGPLVTLDRRLARATGVRCGVLVPPDVHDERG